MQEASKGGLDQLVNKFNVCLHAIARVLPYRVCYKLCFDVCHVWCKQKTLHWVHCGNLHVYLPDVQLLEDFHADAATGTSAGQTL